MLKILKLIVLISFFFLISFPLLAKAKVSIGVIGDSYSDEYAFYPPDRTTAKNWVELLSEFRKINFGEFTRGSRSIPRKEGYEFNFALSGATTDDAIQNQVPGIVDLAANGSINFVIIFIGGNDFYRLISGNLSSEHVETVINTASNNVEAIIDTIKDKSEAPILLVTIPKVFVTQEVSSSLGSGAKANEILGKVQSATNSYNSNLKRLSLITKKTFVFDFDKILDKVFEKKKFKIGKIEIDRSLASNDFNSFFLKDVVHPGTIGQLIFANGIINSLNRVFNKSIKRFSEAEMLKIAKMNVESVF